MRKIILSEKDIEAILPITGGSYTVVLKSGRVIEGVDSEAVETLVQVLIEKWHANKESKTVE